MRLRVSKSLENRTRTFLEKRGELKERTLRTKNAAFDFRKQSKVRVGLTFFNLKHMIMKKLNHVIVLMILELMNL